MLHLRHQSNTILLAVGLSLVAVSSSRAADGINGSLVTVQWLDQHLTDANLLILDASPTPTYQAKHIQGAINVDLFSWYGVQERTVAEMERFYQQWGVSPGKRIVAYDQGGTFLATRLFYQLYYHGFPAGDLFVLDGGLAKWQEQGFSVTSEAAVPSTRGTFTVTTVNESVRARLPEVLTATGDPLNSVLIDALGPDWHFGEVAPFDRPGHIPNGLPLPSADFFNADKTFKSPDEIKRMLQYFGIRPEQQVYSFCGGGVAASVPFFALKFMANYPNVKLYKESEMGWLADDRQLPFWTYDAPFLLRDARWLQAWGGARIRAFGGAQVSVVDVRSPAAYSEGHLPFAVNVPGDTLRRYLSEPERLGEVLSSAGVDPAHEAVVVSDGAVTKDAALAFLLLEQLGQAKVSIFTAPVSEWKALGLKQGAISGVPRYEGTRAAHAAKVHAPTSERADYPRIFVASGDQMPAKAPGESVVHVRYTDLLDAAGLPKPAKDVWNVLHAAGVSHYAELICFADDPAEAAVNYFVLRLMGFRHVRVLMR